jgi:peroxiredoxin
MATLAIGATAIPFDLPGVDGRQHTLDDYADTPVLAVVFTCNHCPYAQAWEGRLIQLQRDYAERGVAFVAINANDPVKHPGDNFDAMVERARTYEYPYPYLQDLPQHTARAYGAERTPEVFVFDATRQLGYHGAPDDNREIEQVSQHYLRDAIEAALAGQPAPVAETPAVGCTIKWAS